MNALLQTATFYSLLLRLSSSWTAFSTLIPILSNGDIHPVSSYA